MVLSTPESRLKVGVKRRRGNGCVGPETLMLRVVVCETSLAR